MEAWRQLLKALLLTTLLTELIFRTWERDKNMGGNELLYSISRGKTVSMSFKKS